MIYYQNNDQRRIDRFNYLSNNGIANFEYYPVRSILKFGFGNFAKFSKQQKIEILERMIASHSGENHDEHHKIFVIIDTEHFIYSPFAADCEVLGREMLIVAAPFYSYSVLTIKSPKATQEIIGHITRGSKPHIIEHRSTMKMLCLLLDCLRDTGAVADFLERLRNNTSGFYKPVLNVLPPEIKASLPVEHQL
jgi:hypothetical protein